MGRILITVYLAKNIITMNDAWPGGTAIAVRDGMILEVGTIETLQTWLQEDDYRIDEQFKDKVIMPGFIDPHLHPMMAAVLLPMRFITAMPWEFPWESVPATTTHADYLAALTHSHETLPEGQPFFTWG